MRNFVVQYICVYNVYFHSIFIVATKKIQKVDDSHLSPYILNKCCLMPASWRAAIYHDTTQSDDNNYDLKMVSEIISSSLISYWDS